MDVSIQEGGPVLASESRVSRATGGCPTPRSDLVSTSAPAPLLGIFLKDAFGSRQVEHKAQLLGSGLLAKGCQPNAQQFVGIFAPNRPEVGLWVDPPTSILFFKSLE